MYDIRTEKSPKVNKWLKVAAWVTGAALILFVGLFFFTIWLEQKVERLVTDQSKGVYKLQLHGLKISPFLGNLAADSVLLQPDYTKWKELSLQGQEVPRVLLDLRTGPVNLRNLSHMKALFERQVQLAELEVQKPILLLSVMRPDTTSSHLALHETAKGFLKGLAIGNIKVQQASMFYCRGATTDTLSSVRDIQLVVDDFRLDSASFAAKDRAYYAKMHKLTAASTHLLLSDELYKLSTDSLLIDTESGEVLLQQVKIMPLAEPAAMARAKGEAVTHQEAAAELLTLRGVDFGEHSRTNKVHIKHVLLQTPTLNAFKDKKNFQDKGNKRLPHEMAQSIKTPFKLDSIEVRSGYIRYAELAPEAEERGHIAFHHINALITNLSNMPEQVTIKKPAVIQAKTWVMDRANLDVTIRLPLLHDAGYHTIEGTIGETNLQLLNPILIPTSFVKLESGQVRSGKFRAELSQAAANGSMTLIYNNLKVDLLSKDADKDQSFGKKLLSKLANKVAIKESNPSKGEEPRVGEISVSRDPQKSVFNYWKECLSSGFLSSMGLEGMAEK